MTQEITLSPKVDTGPRTMFMKFVSLMRLIWPYHKWRLIRLHALMILNAILELAGLVSLVPFASVIAIPNFVEMVPMLKTFVEFLGLTDRRELILTLGLTSFVFIALGNLVAAAAIVKAQAFAFDLGRFFGSRLFYYYLKQDYFFHITHRQSDFIKDILQECNRLTNYIVVPFLQSNIYGLMCIFILAGLLVVKPLVSIMIFALMGTAFVGVYLVLKPMLERNGRRISESARQQYRSVNMAFAGIKTVKLVDSEDIFVDMFNNASKDMNSALLFNFAAIVHPPYIVQVVVFGSLCLGVTAMFYITDLDPAIGSTILFFVIAGYRILPALKQIFSNLSLSKGHIAAYDEIYESLKMVLSVEYQNKAKFKKIPFEKELELKDVTFKYKGRAQTLKQLNMKVKKGQIIGLAGPSGGGKTTAADVLSGLLHPDTGQFIVDGYTLTNDDLMSWRANCSYVTQALFFIDGTIAENVAFGSKDNVIDDDRVIEALKKANLYDFAMSLDGGIHGDIGEAGSKLSGGQRQRIGIARAVYRDSDLLILDEATSAMDGMIEQNVMNDILSGCDSQSIIIIAHRLLTLKRCDLIYFLHDGRIEDCGTYEELVKKNPIFRKMAYEDTENSEVPAAPPA